MSMSYSELALDHAESPRNVGIIQNPDGIGADVNPVCGDVVTFFIRVEDGRIADAKYQVKGCTGAIAAASVMSELVQGVTLDDADRLNHQSVLDALGGLPTSKLHSAALAEAVLKRALSSYRQTAG